MFVIERTSVPAFEDFLDTVTVTFDVHNLVIFDHVENLEVHAGFEAFGIMGEHQL